MSLIKLLNGRYSLDDQTHLSHRQTLQQMIWKCLNKDFDKSVLMKLKVLACEESIEETVAIALKIRLLKVRQRVSVV